MTTTLTRPREAVVRINRTYAQLYEIACRYMVVYGGRRSSKSWSISQLLVRRAIEIPPRKIVVQRKYAVNIRLSVWDRIQSALAEAGLEPERDFTVNKSDRTIHLANGSSFHFVGADDPNKLKSLEGVTDFWLEEANEFDELDLDTIDAGLSGDASEWPCQIWLSFNPVPTVPGYVPWLARRYVLAVPHEMSRVAISGETCVLRTWYKDNRFCPKAIVDLFHRYETESPELYQLWVLGKYTYLEGVILRNWDVVGEVPEGATFLGYGLDWGFADDPVAVIKVWKRGREVWVQQVVYSTDITNPELSVLLEEAGARKHEDYFIADSAEPKSIRELRGLGWIVQPCEKGSDYKRAAIRYLKSLRIHVVAGSTDVVKEISTWSWRKDKTSGRFLPIPVDLNDHTIDALIYRVYSRRVGDELPGQGKQSDLPARERSGLTGIRGRQF